MYKIIKKRKIWFFISGLFVVLSILSLILWGLDFGIDFTGGSLLEVAYKGERPSVVQIKDTLNDLDLNSLTVQPVADKGDILRFQNVSEKVHQKILNKLNDLSKSNSKDNLSDKSTTTPITLVKGKSASTTQATTTKVITNLSRNNTLEELRFDSVGPSIGKELKQKSIYAIFFVLIAIILYIAWVFRKVSKPISSWKYGLAAIIALFHDVIITLGVFSILGKFFGAEINTPFVAAILTVLGYSVNDTIVVFDRIRENLPKSNEDFEGTVNTSVNQTISRSINTSLTTLLVLISILVFGGTTIKNFVLALSIGVFVGTYSSIFIASPILVFWEKWKANRIA